LGRNEPLLVMRDGQVCVQCKWIADVCEQRLQATLASSLLARPVSAALPARKAVLWWQGAAPSV
jgi:hypothetical protein